VSETLEARRLHVRHPGGDRDALRDVTLALQPGEILALVGPNGSGKSTLLAALGRELRVRQGRALLGGRPVAELTPRRFARRVARLPQDPVTPEGLRVEDLVALGRHPHRGFFAAMGARDRDAIGDALDAVSLAGHRKRKLETLSGGERRRAWLAMVLAQEPEVLLLDEPTAALDLRHQWELLALLRELNAERQVSIVASLHDLEQAAGIAHRMAVLFRGRVYAVGKPADVVDEPMLLDVFGVEARVSPERDQGRGLRIQVLGPGDPLRSL
jgi:iron complex transport system ATP-binding protein